MAEPTQEMRDWIAELRALSGKSGKPPEGQSTDGGSTAPATRLGRLVGPADGSYDVDGTAVRIGALPMPPRVDLGALDGPADNANDSGLVSVRVGKLNSQPDIAANQDGTSVSLGNPQLPAVENVSLPQRATNPHAGPVTSDGANNTINSDFIRKQEGFKTDGYVPMNRDGSVIGQSGVTVGNGVDMGAQTAARLKALGVDDETIKLLMSYFGWKREVAAGVLAAEPLSLTKGQAEDLSNRLLSTSAEEVAARFDKDSASKRFADLPSNTKTMLTSIYHQYGPQLFSSSFWRQVTSGDWEGARKNLMDFGDKTPTRRRTEAGLLSQDIQNGSLSGRQRQSDAPQGEGEPNR